MSCLSECVALREYGYGLAHRAAMKRSYRVERRTSRVRIPVWPTWGLSTSISGGEVAKGAMLETELFALLEQTADAAYTVTEGGEICSWNGAAERLFGYPASEVLHRDVDQRRRNEERFYRMLEVARQLVALAGDASHHAPVEPLSEQELRILKLFAEGRNSATIARKLSISAQTLRNHLHHINHKLRTHTRLEAVTHAQQRGLLE